MTQKKPAPKNVNGKKKSTLGARSANAAKTAQKHVGGLADQMRGCSSLGNPLLGSMFAGGPAGVNDLIVRSLDAMGMCVGPKLEELAPGVFREIEAVRGIDLEPKTGTPTSAKLLVYRGHMLAPEEIATEKLDIIARVLERCGQGQRAKAFLGSSLLPDLTTTNKEASANAVPAPSSPDNPG